MEIYKRGQGVYTRGVAIVLFILVVAWGCYEVYDLPSRTSVVVKVGDPVTAEMIKMLRGEKFDKLRVTGLANQPVGPGILNQVCSHYVEDEDGNKIVLAEEKYTPERVKDLEKAKIRFVPVKDRNIVRVEHVLAGMEVGQDVQLRQFKTADYAEPGKPLTEEILDKLRKENKGLPFLAPEYFPTFDDFKSNNREKAQRGKSNHDLKPGNVLTQKPGWNEFEVILEKGGRVTAAVIETLKAQKAQIPFITVEDKGTLKFDEIAGALDAIDGRTLRANQPRKVETWWIAGLFTVPLVNLNVTPVLLVAIGLFILLSLGVLLTWNWKRWNDLLIETQMEMKKVSWPKRQELIGSSVIVIVMVLIMGFFLYVVDIVLTFISSKSGLYAGG
jgi:preprotein translocase subunit SecE